MGSQVECKSYFSMREFNEDSNSNNNWSLFYGDKNLMGVKLCNGYTAYVEYDKDTLKQKILEHEAIFRNQVYELHRLYRIQNDMMEDIRRKELHKCHSSIDLSSSSSIGGSQILAGDAIKWRFPVCSPMSCTKGGNVILSESRTLKVREKLFDLQLPPVDDEYLDTEEGGNMSKTINPPVNNGCNGGGRIDCHVSTSESCRTSSMRLTDLNEPVIVEDGLVSSTVDYILGDSSLNREEHLGLPNSMNPISQFLGSHIQNSPNVHRENSGPNLDHVSVTKKGRDSLCDLYQSGPKNNNIISTLSHSISIGDKWQSNGKSRFVPGGSVDHLPFTNGFCRGFSSSSSSGSKETWAHQYPSSRFSHLGCDIVEEDNVHIPLKDMDLNVEFSSIEEMDDKRNLNSMLPWLNSSKPSLWTESVKESPNECKRRRLIDINLVCEDDEEEEEEEIVTCSRIYIDLNSDLDGLERTESCFASVIDINEDHDLLPEDHNHEEEESLKPVPVEDEASLLMAAEAIMSLSSNRDSLLWFADAICTVDKEAEFDRSKNGLKHGKYLMDEFEIMTLQIEETKEEEYMPTPFFHQVEEIEELGGGPTKSASNNRGRRRRGGGGGRQRRDFQRDILPGLVSLSRHEITLDIQTLSGLMKKATGQTWRKCGGAGGRRRQRRMVVVGKASSFNGVSCITTTTPLVQKLSTTIEASLGGWGGKIIRRGPRRQRCPQLNNNNNNNNNNNVPLT